ncbi:MAG: MEKHLA domain-containing protein [Rhodoplanes sp.]
MPESASHALRRRFLIERATVWNLLDRGGDYAGQAAMFRHWRPAG